MNTILKQIRPALAVFVILSAITGILYPWCITYLSNKAFPYQANGSLIVESNYVIGSELIGQKFTSQTYLWSRPSATSNNEYNALSSGGSNLSPSNIALLTTVESKIALLQQTNNTAIPIDLVTSSASGLDPEISINAAYFQIPRIANSLHVSPLLIKQIIDSNAKYPILGIIGNPRVNVLLVNIELSKIINNRR